MGNSNERAVRKTVIRSLPGFWVHSFLSGLVFLAIQVAGLIPAILMQRVVDIYIPNGQLEKVVWSILLFCLIPLLVTVLSTAYRYKLAIVCRRMGLQLALKGFHNLLYQQVSYFDQQNSAELAVYCRGESMKYIVFWMIDIPQLCATGLCGILLLSYIFSLHWSLALLLLLYFPIAFFPSNFLSQKVEALSRKITENNAKMAQIISDAFRGIKTVKAMALEKIMIDKLSQVNEDSVSVWSKVSLCDNLSGIWINDFSDALFKGVSFGISAFLTVRNAMTFGGIVVVINYVDRFLGVAKRFMETNYRFKEQLGEFDKLFEILTLPTNTQEEGKPFKLCKEIVFENVDFAYNSERGDVLKSMNLTIYAGEWLGIVGASGSGKTTVFDLLLRFYDPQKGCIWIDGENVNNFSLSSLHSKVAKVSQETFLFPGTVRENLELASADVDIHQLNTVLEQVQLSELIHRLPRGLDTEIGEDGQLLSGGERQRLGLAQGLLRNCEVILLDEVTANVDPDSERAIKEVLTQLRKERNLTIITISHRIDFLENTDRIVVIENGNIRCETTYEHYIEQ